MQTDEQQKQPQQQLMTREEAFSMMDQSDDAQIVAAMSGKMASADQIEKTFYYQFPADGGMVEGLSKTGIDECCNAMMTQGIYFEECELDHQADPGDPEYHLFTAKVIRFKYDSNGKKQITGTAYGSKRQWRYQFSNKWVEENGKRVKKKVKNPDKFFFEKGQQKACRNARQDLVPWNIKNEILQNAKEIVKATREGCTLKDMIYQELSNTYKAWKDELFPYEYIILDADRKPVDMTTKDLSWEQVASDEFLCQDRKNSNKSIKTRCLIQRMKGIAAKLPKFIHPRDEQSISTIKAFIVIQKREQKLVGAK